MTRVDLVGVPFDGFGRPGNQARAASALREAGFAKAFERHEVVAADDLELPPGDGSRADGSGLLNEAALIAMTDALNERVARDIRAGIFPVVYGGDCSSLLGSMTGLRDAVGSCGLLFVDGHEDTMPLDVSEDGEAANTEIGLLLGLTGYSAPESLRARLPVLSDANLAVVGPRDEAWRRRFNVGSLRDRGVWQRSVEEIAAGPAGVARDAVGHLLGAADNWWLHIDLDVLDPVEFPSQGLPGVEDAPGGLTWPHLTELAGAAASMIGCRGLSLTIYDPDQDSDLSDAAQIVKLAAVIASKRAE